MRRFQKAARGSNKAAKKSSAKCPSEFQLSADQAVDGAHVTMNANAYKRDCVANQEDSLVPFNLV